MSYGLTTSSSKYSANNANESAYSAENVTPGGYGLTVSNWILRDGTWRDDGVWIDTETWNDG